jgi:hypothetical protein
MAELSVIRDLVTIFGVIAGLTYYVMTVQSQRKNQKLNSIHSWLATHQDRDFAWYWEEVMRWKWVDYDDFTEKYWSDPETASKFYTVINYYEGIGYLWKSGVLDLDDFGVRWFGPWCVNTYWKFKPIINDFREISYSDWMKNWEELTDELESRLIDRMNPEWVQRVKPTSL